jgi:hypothetical protein
MDRETLRDPVPMKLQINGTGGDEDKRHEGE